MSTMDVKMAFAMELRRSGVFPVESRIDEPFASSRKVAHAMGDLLRWLMTQRWSLALASSVEFSRQVVSRSQRDHPDEKATQERREPVRLSYSHMCVEDGEQRARANELWSHISRWDAQAAGSATRKRKDNLHARLKDVTKC